MALDPKLSSAHRKESSVCVSSLGSQHSFVVNLLPEFPTNQIVTAPRHHIHATSPCHKQYLSAPVEPTVSASGLSKLVRLAVCLLQLVNSMLALMDNASLLLASMTVTPTSSSTVSWLLGSMEIPRILGLGSDNCDYVMFYDDFAFVLR